MFQKNILGESSPLQLLQTVIYMLGLHLALRGGVEHSRLRRPGFNSQIVVNVDEKGRKRLVYREDPLQKTNQGGLGSKGNVKSVQVYESEDKARCPVRLFMKYVGLLPDAKTCRKLYMRPKIKAIPSCWYNDQPYGNNKIYSTVKELCSKAGFEGKFTNHSLRATSASRMFQANVPEQVIKEVTGHRSDCVRSYKRTSDDIREHASRTISCGNEAKKRKIVKEVKEPEVDKECDSVFDAKVKKRLEESLSAFQMVRNVVKTKMELRKKKKMRGIECLKKVANKLVRKQKQKVVKRVGKKKPKSYVIDVNLNVKVTK